MKIIENKTKFFKADGSFRLKGDMPSLLNTILVIIIVNNKIGLHELNLELRRCGFYVSHPDLKKITARMLKEGVVESKVLGLEINNN